MEPSNPHTVIYQCKNPECSFRFPSPQPLTIEPLCPRCKTPTQIVPYADEVQREPGQATEGNRLAVFLDNIRSTFNVGAMLRTADGAGLERLYLSGITPLPDHAKISKTALGAEFAVPWSYSNNGVHLAQELVDSGSRLIALETRQDAISIYDYALPGDDRPNVLVVGNEVTGIDPGILDLCAASVYIPMAGYKRSLNVAIAFGIAVYTLRYHQPILPAPSNSLKHN